MRRPCFLWIVVVAAVVAGAAPAMPPALDLQDDIDQAISLNQGYGGGIFRVHSGIYGLLWEGVSGEAVHNGPPIPSDATFEIASTSKTLTAATVLLLIEDGAIAYDQPIGEILPPSYTTGLLVIDGHDYGPELTVRQLLAHTSGLPDYWYDPPWVGPPGVNAFLRDYIDDPNRFWTPEEILSYVPDLSPVFVPGTGWHYSDTGYVLAGLIIEEVTGQELHEVYRERIFGPLGLQDAWLHWRELPTCSCVESHRYEWTWDMYDKRHNSADWGGGGLVSSTRDLERFIRALADGILFSDPGTLNEMTTWIPTGTPGVKYGLGLFRVALGDGEGHIWGHDGYGNSWMYYWPRHDVTFVGTLNQTENDWWPLVKAATSQIEAAGVPGDLDGDGNVDLVDFVTFAGCFAGAGIASPPPGCDPADFAGADLDGDNDVDLADFITFGGNFTG